MIFFPKLYKLLFTQSRTILRRSSLSDELNDLRSPNFYEKRRIIFKWGAQGLYTQLISKIIP